MCTHLGRGCIEQLLQVRTPDIRRLLKDYVVAIADCLPAAEEDAESPKGRRMVRPIRQGRF